MSKQLHIEKDGGVLKATYRWRSPKAYTMALLCLLWDGFMLYWYGRAWYTGELGETFFLYPVLHLGVGIGLTYYTLCLFFNRSLILVDRQHIDISHRPLPWWGGDWDIPITEVRQLYVKKHRRKKKRGVSRSYGLYVQRVNGEKETLLDIYAPDSRDMEDLEAAIEEQLQIVDRPIAGEYRSPEETAEPVPAPPPVWPRESAPTEAGFPADWAAIQRGNSVAEQPVTHTIQYDWADGHTDWLLHLAGTAGPLAIYLDRESAQPPRPYATRQLDAAERALLPFAPELPPERFEHAARSFALQTHRTGHFFPDHLRHQGGIPVQQWIYRSADPVRLRFVHYSGMTELYREEILDQPQLSPTPDER